MKLTNISNFFFVLSVTIIFSACSNTTLNNTNNDVLTAPTKEIEVKKVEEKPIEKKIVEAKREDISPSLINSIKHMIYDFSRHDLSMINQKYIHPKFGFYNLYKIDDIKTFNHQKQIYNIVESDYYELSNIINDLPSEIKNLPVIEQDVKFDCSPMDDEFYGWNGDGLYISKNTRTYLSTMMIRANEVQPNKYTKNDLNKAYFIERTSYKVILTPELIFYVNKIDKKWYITLFDRITTDCTEALIK